MAAAVVSDPAKLEATERSVQQPCFRRDAQVLLDLQRNVDLYCDLSEAKINLLAFSLHDFKQTVHNVVLSVGLSLLHQCGSLSDSILRCCFNILEAHEGFENAREDRTACQENRPDVGGHDARCCQHREEAVKGCNVAAIVSGLRHETEHATEEEFAYDIKCVPMTCEHNKYAHWKLYLCGCIVLEGNIPLYPRGHIDGISLHRDLMKFLHESLGTIVDIRLRADNVGHGI